MKQMNKTDIQMLFVLELIVGSIGFLLLFWVDWRVAVGTALAIWGNNIAQLKKRWIEKREINGLS